MIDVLAGIFLAANGILYLSFGCMVCYTAIQEKWECV